MRSDERLRQLDPATYAKIAKAVPVHDDDAERMLIGGILRFPERFVDLSDRVTPDQFYQPQHRAIWEAMQYLQEDARPIDIVTVHERLAEMKPFTTTPDWKLQELALESLTAANAEQWAERIVRTWRVRTIFFHASHVVGMACEPGADPDSLLESLEEIEEKLADREPSCARTMGDVALQVLSELDDARKSRKPPGTPTGFLDFDRTVGGLHPGHLVIVAARPGMGKTAFAGNLACNVAGVQAGEGRPVLFCTIEMPDKDISKRLLSSISGVNSIRIRDALVNDEEMELLQKARVKLGRSKLWVADVPSVTVGQIAGLARRVKHKCGDLAAVVVDYLQLVSQHNAHSMTREQQVSEVARKLKQLARQLDCTVVALSQLNRTCEQRPDKRPLLSDLRESGEIEQAADVVTALYRHEYYHQDDEESKGKAELINLKARHGGVGTIDLRFEKSTTTFQNLANTDFEPPPPRVYAENDF
jgi:replicative DNA helicase